MPNISRIKGNQTLKFGQLIDYNNRNISFGESNKNKVGTLVPDLFLFFKNALYEVKANGLKVSFIQVWLSSTWQTIKNKIHATL